MSVQHSVRRLLQVVESDQGECVLVTVLWPFNREWNRVVMGVPLGVGPAECLGGIGPAKEHMF